MYPEMFGEWQIIVDMCKPTEAGGPKVRRETILAIDARIRELEAIVDEFATALDEIATKSEEHYASHRAAEALGLI